VHEHTAAGPEYLQLITALLQRARLADDEAGLWEAGDLQWWWRRDQHADPENARFWIDDDGVPVGAVILTDWGDRWGCDVIAMPHKTEFAIATLWPNALDRLTRLNGTQVEVAVGDDDEVTAAMLRGAGFAVVVADDHQAMSCWMPAHDRPAIPPIAAGYQLRSIAQGSAHPHHMLARNGPHVAERLQECSMYRPELDLYIESPDGEVAGYGLFWADPVTRVGLVEPMRTEDSHQGKGLATHLLRSGLDLLARHGCTRLKVTYLEGNEPARLLYVGSGFQPRTRSQNYVRSPGP
jgi:GNAT superfamily N-acetyltransferase